MQLFVVPWSPGSLATIETCSNEAPYERPPSLDNMLYGIGFLCSVGYVVVAAHGVRLPRRFLLLGVPGVLHLLVVPVLAACHRQRIGREARLRRQVLGDALLLDPSDPDVLALIVEYRAVLVASRYPAVAPMAHEVVSAAHSAMVETALAVGGRPPVGQSERAHVRQRIAALTMTASALQHRHETAVAAAARQGREIEEVERKARLDAIREVYEQDQGGSLARLEVLRRELDRHELDWE